MHDIHYTDTAVKIMYITYKRKLYLLRKGDKKYGILVYNISLWLTETV